jgi:hypothetical protein
MADIRVAVRVRPSPNTLQVWTIDSENNSIQAAGSSVGFTFNRVFAPEEKNFEVYQSVASDIIDEMMKGTNATIFAYGSTGSGKTYTMMGEGSEPGITPLAVDHIFRYVEHHTERIFLIEFSYFEIYNEKVHDLLNDRAVADVKIRYTQQTAKSAQFLIDTIIAAEANRSTGSTSMNEHSSRSHAIVRIMVESYPTDGDGSIRLTSVLNLVDLAGSECQKNTNADGDRQYEASKINKSLLALSKLIDSLQNGKSLAVWRESKLTLYLQNSIGGNALTAIIYAINSELSQKSTSEYTLRFASKAMKVRNQPKVNQIVTDKGRIEQLNEENRLLRERLEVYEVGEACHQQSDDFSDDAIELPRKILSRNAVNVAKRLLSTPPRQSENDSDGQLDLSPKLSPIEFQPSPIQLPKRKPRVMIERVTEDDADVDREADSLSREILMRVRTSNSPFSRLSELGTRNDEETQADLISGEIEWLIATTSELESEKAELDVRFSELESEFRARVSELEKSLAEKEHLLENASNVSAKLKEQQEIIADLRTRLTRKEADLKGSNFTRSIIQSKLEQKDLTLIRFGERIQSQREEIESLTSQIANRDRRLNELTACCEMLSNDHIEKQRVIEEEQTRQKQNRETKETETELTHSDICQMTAKAQRVIAAPPPTNYATVIEKLKERTKIIPAPPRKRTNEDVCPNQIATIDKRRLRPPKLTFQSFVVANYLIEIESDEEHIGKDAETQTATEKSVEEGFVWRTPAAISEFALLVVLLSLIVSWVSA